MKKILLLFLSAVLMLTAGCSFKVDRDTFHLPENEVKSLAIQREYQKEDGSGTYYCQKVIANEEDIREVTRVIRELPMRRVTDGEPRPITEFSMIIVIGGKREHRLVLNDEIAFYDQVPYEYEKKDVYQKIVSLYEKLNYPEEETEPNRFK